jgi:RNA polymerase sigma-54 factor
MFQDYQEMMQTYKDSRDKSAQQKMQYSLLNKNWIRLNGLSMIRQRQETLLLP